VATTGDNFYWNMPTTQVGLDFDYRVGENFALNAGISCDASSSSSLWGGNAGIGFPFRGDDLSGRLELGVHWQTLLYDASTVLVRETMSIFSSSETTVYHLRDIDRETPWNMYASLTLNTKSEGALNGFASISYSRQTVANFQPKHVVVISPIVEYIYTDARLEQTVNFIGVTPGIAFSISPKVRLLGGVHLMWEMAIDNGNTLFVSPMAQVEMGL
jgi:hypothetical protein